MVSQLPVRIRWEGRTSINDIRLFISQTPYKLPEHLGLEKIEIWDEIKQRDPMAYDGKIFLAKIQSLDPLSVKLIPIQYSDFKTLQFTKDEQVKSGVFGSYAAFCIIYLIFNDTRKYLLSNRRNPIGEWGDGYWACPGGMVEYNPELIRGNNEIDALLFSELKEEVKEPLAFSKFYLEGILEARNEKFTNLILTTQLTTPVDLNKSVLSNSEFPKHELQWKGLKEILNMDDDQLFGGLRFLKYRKSLD